MDASLQEFVVSQHNVYRGIIARGELPGYLPAAKIPMMKWSQELADIALFNAKTCTFAHDQCRNTADFHYAGQNIAIFPKNGVHYTPTEAINGSLALFFDEYKYAQQSNMDSYKNAASG